MQFSSSWEVDSEKANHDYSFKWDNIYKTLNIADPESMLNNACYYYFLFFILENIITLEYFIEQLHLKINLSGFIVYWKHYVHGVSLFWWAQQAQKQYFPVEGIKSMH